MREEILFKIRSLKVKLSKSAVTVWQRLSQEGAAKRLEGRTGKLSTVKRMLTNESSSDQNAING